jgi:hypothetical protein
MVNRALSFALTACAVLACASSHAAERFLTPDQMISALADGAPWAMKTADGMQANLTLRKDGTGVFEGPFTGPSTWTISGEDVCMIVKMPMPVTKLKCFRLTRMTSGYQAYEGNTPVFTLKR